MNYPFWQSFDQNNNEAPIHSVYVLDSDDVVTGWPYVSLLSAAYVSDQVTANFGTHVLQIRITQELIRTYNQECLTRNNNAPVTPLGQKFILELLSGRVAQIFPAKDEDGTPLVTIKIMVPKK